MMNEERVRIVRAYRRAAIGLAAGAAVWLAALIVTDTAKEEKAAWLIPAVCALLSFFFYSLSKRSKQ